MAKLAFTKLGLKVNDEIKTIEFNEQTIEVKQYLPVSEKLEVIAAALNNSADDNNFANPVKVDVYATIAIIEAYTNITFTEKQKENTPKLYDAIISSGLYASILAAMPHEEINAMIVAINDTIEAFYRYRNSVMGILDILKLDYSDLDLNATAIKDKLADEDNLTMLRSILSKLG